MLPPGEARRLGLVPVEFVGRDELVVAVANPNYLAFDDVSMMTGRRVRPIVIPQDDLDALLRRISLLDDSLTRRRAAGRRDRDGDRRERRRRADDQARALDHRARPSTAAYRTSISSPTTARSTSATASTAS